MRLVMLPLFALIVGGPLSSVSMAGSAEIRYDVDPWLVGSSGSSEPAGPWGKIKDFKPYEVFGAELSFTLPLEIEHAGEKYTTDKVSLEMTVVDTLVVFDALFSATIDRLSESILIEIWAQDGTKAGFFLESQESFETLEMFSRFAPPHPLLRLHEFAGYFFVEGENWRMFSDYNSPLDGPPRVSHRVPDGTPTGRVLLCALLSAAALRHATRHKING